MRKLLATLALALVASTTVEAQQQVVVEGVKMNLYLTDYGELYDSKADRVTEGFYGDVRIGVSSDRSLVWVTFGEGYFNALETVFVEDSGSSYLLKVRKMHTYKNNILSESEYLEFYVIVYKNINCVAQTSDFENFLIYRGL